MRFIFLLLFGTSFVNPLSAQYKAKDSFTLAMAASDSLPENYNAPLHVLKNITVDSSDRFGRSMWLQAMMTYHSFAGNYDSTLFYADARYGVDPDTLAIKMDTSFVQNYQLFDAADYLVARAGQHQITLINEAHHIPAHRAFLIGILDGFKKAGYRYLAIETLQDSLININRKVGYNSGYYSREPLFAEAIRYALKLGFHLLPYESQVECDEIKSDRNYCNSFRDSVMAVNLSKVLKQDPTSKILVYAGYDHIHKGNDNGWKKMAQFVEEITGIEPLSIDQTVHSEHYYPQFATKEFLAINQAEDMRRPVVAVKGNRVWHGKFVDVSVIHPRYRVDPNRRPSFYKLNGLREPYDLSFLDLDEGRTVQAFYSEDTSGERIPADQLQANHEDHVLYLFPGQYTLEIKDKDGNLLSKKAIDLR